MQLPLRWSVTPAVTRQPQRLIGRDDGFGNARFPEVRLLFGHGFPPEEKAECEKAK
jgi:hypothetical protein